VLILAFIAFAWLAARNRDIRYLDSRTNVLAAMSHDLRTLLRRRRLASKPLPKSGCAHVSQQTSTRWKLSCTARSRCSKAWTTRSDSSVWT